MSNRQSFFTTPEDFAWLHTEFKNLNGFGKFNCILTDGHRLFCYRDDQGRGGLEWCSRELPAHRSEHFSDSELAVAVESADTIRATIVATKALGGTGWKEFEFGELIVLQKGVNVFSSVTAV